MSIGPSLHLRFCAFKRATLVLELLFPIGPIPHLWLLHAKSAFWIRITSLYGSQPSSVVFANKTATLGPELIVSMGPRPHLAFCECKTT